MTASLLSFVLFGCALISLLGWRLAERAGWSWRDGALTVLAGLVALRLLLGALGLTPRGRRRRLLGGRSLPEIDRLSGAEFESWVHERLRAHGFAVEATPRSGDFGVDFIVHLHELRIAVEAKRRVPKISNANIRSAVAGAQHHGCQGLAVVTQSTFSDHAARQAKDALIPVEFIGREELVVMKRKLHALADRCHILAE